MSTTIFPQNFSKKITGAAFVLVLSTTFAGGVLAGEREQAKRIHDRLAGVPPSAAVLTAMENDIVDGRPNDAALKALANPNFYRVTLKNFITPWTNEAQTVFEPLNDYTSTVIGIVRDDYDFRSILYSDILYIGNTAGLTPYSPDSNAHYKEMEDRGIDLMTDLVETTQTSLGLPAGAAAGVMTSRAAARAFFVDGTNRAMFRFTLLNHLCSDMEQLKDPGYSPDRVRQDVSRSPGGDSRIFMNACVGCHNGMDPMTQAFAYYDYTYPMNGDEPDYDAGRLVYTPGLVQPKYAINVNNFEHGYVTLNDEWDNYWRTGSNSALGWDLALPGKGRVADVTNGAASMGQELAHSNAFARCQVEKVFKAVCLHAPVSDTDLTQIDKMIDDFRDNDYKLKQVFADSAVFCMGN